MRRGPTVVYIPAEALKVLADMYPMVYPVLRYNVDGLEDGVTYSRRAVSFMEPYNDGPELKFKAMEYFWKRKPETRGKVFLADITLSFSPATPLLSAVFLDDVLVTTPAHILIETSPGNWHAHIRLSREVSDDVALSIQKHLAHETPGTNAPTADFGALGARHGRRYPTEGLRYSTMSQLPLFDVDDFLQSHPVEQPKPVHAVPRVSRKKLPLPKEALRDIWNRYLGYAVKETGRPDMSFADLDMIKYLLERGWSDAEVMAAVKRVSSDIVARHPQTDHYLLLRLATAKDRLTKS